MRDIEVLVSDLRDLLGEDLRTVVEYDREDFEIAHVRDDVDEAYVRDAFSEFKDEVIVSQIGVDRTDGIRSTWSNGDAEGDIQVSGVLYWTGRATVVHVGDDRYRGVVVSIEPDSDVSMSDLRETCAGRSGRD